MWSSGHADGSASLLATSMDMACCAWFVMSFTSADCCSLIRQAMSNRSLSSSQIYLSTALLSYFATSLSHIEVVYERLLLDSLLHLELDCEAYSQRKRAS